MNEADIKKCIKNGFCWSSYGKKPEREMGFGKGGARGKNWPLFLTGSPENYHATYAAAKLVIATRREQVRVDARKADADPRDSEIVILNYPWLKDEAGDKPSPTSKSVASHETTSNETKAEKVSTGETQKPREWQDIPQPLTPRKPTQTVLEEAMKCVGGPRRRDYGTPDENFGRIADLWNVHLKGKLAKPVTPGDVAMMMILMKVARQANSPKRDNLVDIAGYAQCASELKEEK